VYATFTISRALDDEKALLSCRVFGPALLFGPMEAIALWFAESSLDLKRVSCNVWGMDGQHTVQKFPGSEKIRS
jgi:hypothetical protein